MMPKRIVKRLHPICVLADCLCKGKPMNVVVYEDGTYRGGHHFTSASGGELILGGYWECPSCYWGKGAPKPVEKVEENPLWYLEQAEAAKHE